MNPQITQISARANARRMGPRGWPLIIMAAVGLALVAHACGVRPVWAQGEPEALQEAQQALPPAWVIPVVAAAGVHPPVLLDAFEAAAAAGGTPTLTPDMCLAARDIVATQRLPWRVGEASEYSQRVLLLLQSPVARLFTPEQRLALINEVVLPYSRALLGATAAQLGALANTTDTAQPGEV